jgi:hypothetical protein
MSHCVSQTSPWVPRKAIAADPEKEGGPPLDELVSGADRQADGRGEEEEPARRRKRRFSPQDLPDEDRRYEALQEVPEPVVMVAREPEEIADPEAERNLRVRVVAPTINTIA